MRVQIKIVYISPNNFIEFANKFIRELPITFPVSCIEVNGIAFKPASKFNPNFTSSFDLCFSSNNEINNFINLSYSESYLSKKLNELYFYGEFDIIEDQIGYFKDIIQHESLFFAYFTDSNYSNNQDINFTDCLKDQAVHSESWLQRIKNIVSPMQGSSKQDCNYIYPGNKVSRILNYFTFIGQSHFFFGGIFYSFFSKEYISNFKYAYKLESLSNNVVHLQLYSRIDGGNLFESKESQRQFRSYFQFLIDPIEQEKLDNSIWPWLKKEETNINNLSLNNLPMNRFYFLVSTEDTESILSFLNLKIKSKGDWRKLFELSTNGSVVFIPPSYAGFTWIGGEILSEIIKEPANDKFFKDLSMKFGKVFIWANMNVIDLTEIRSYENGQLKRFINYVGSHDEYSEKGELTTIEEGIINNSVQQFVDLGVKYFKPDEKFIQETITKNLEKIFSDWCPDIMKWKDKNVVNQDECIIADFSSVLKKYL